MPQAWYDFSAMGKPAKIYEDVPAADFGSPDYKPRTPLGERLWRLRQEILKTGEPLLDWDDLEKEVAERRGERDR